MKVMKFRLYLGVVLVIQLIVWAARVAAAPTEVTPREEELDATQSQSAQVSQLKRAPMTSILAPEQAAGTSPPETEAVVRMAVEDLTQRLSLAPEAIRLVSVGAVEWSDASLGCPQPGMMYAQVITPGYRVVLEAGSKRYEYHTDRAGVAVLCQAEGVMSIGTGVEGATGELATPDPQGPYYGLVIKAVEDLAGRLSVDVDEIGVLEVREVVWPDASLGCPQPGMAYKQVPEDGLLIRLAVGGQVHEYHSGGMRDPFLCKQALKGKPPAIQLDLTKTIPSSRDIGDK